MTSESMIARIDEQITEIERRMNDPKLADGTATTWSRVSGYFRSPAPKNSTENTGTWNVGKTEEYKLRTEYIV
jgi:hypothetical protein